MTARVFFVSLSIAVLTTASSYAASKQIAPLALGDSAADLVYTTLPQPCRIIDTRLAGGPLTTTRDFQVTGSTSMAAQGGSASGCGIPFGAATAVMINFVAVNPAGAGNLRGAAYGTAIPSVGSIINYQSLSPALNVANGVVFPVCDSSTSASCTGTYDITVQPNGASTDLVADVVGYYWKYGLGTAGLTYTSLPQPCRLIDTRVAGGTMAAGVSRNFKVVGTTGFDVQGGTAGGCGVPLGAKVAMINFVAVNAQGAGNLKGSAFPNAIPATGSVINYQALNPALNVANGVLFPICDPGTAVCTADITLQPNVSGTDVVADILGFFVRAGMHVDTPPVSEQNLTYTPFPQPCRIIDTRVAGGPLATGVPRNFKVTGSTDMSAQGGSATGCGVPAEATAAMINFVAVDAQGVGNLKGSAFPNAIPTTGNVINYQLLSPPLNIANGLLFPTCDSALTTCTSDITLQANGTGTQVVADVLGYAKRTLAVEPPVQLSPNEVTITAGSTTSFMVLVGPQSFTQNVILQVTPSNAGTLPFSVSIPPGLTSTSFNYTDHGAVSNATITAFMNSTTSEAYVHVTP